MWAVLEYDIPMHYKMCVCCKCIRMLHTVYSHELSSPALYRMALYVTRGAGVLMYVRVAAEATHCAVGGRSAWSGRITTTPPRRATTGRRRTSCSGSGARCETTASSATRRWSTRAWWTCSAGGLQQTARSGARRWRRWADGDDRWTCEHSASRRWRKETRSAGDSVFEMSSDSKTAFSCHDLDGVTEYRWMDPVSNAKWRWSGFGGMA